MLKLIKRDMRKNKHFGNTVRVRVLFAVICVLLLYVALSVSSLGKAEAATVPVSGSCTLDSAVQSLNAASNQGGCTSTGSYGDNDTISLSTGTYAYSPSVAIQVPAVVQGDGMGKTIIDCGGGNCLDFSKSDGTIRVGNIHDLSITNPGGGIGTAAIISTNYAMTIQRVEIYNSSVVATPPEAAIHLTHENSGQPSTLKSINIHDITTAEAVIDVISQGGSTVHGNTLEDISIHDVTLKSGDGTSVAVNILALNGDINATISNITLQDLVGDSTLVINIGAQALSAASGETSISNAQVANVTLRYTQLVPGNAYGLLSYGYAPAGATSQALLSAQNVIIASRVNDTPQFDNSCLAGTGGPGSKSATLTSSGGNLTDDQSCAYFNQPTDQTNLSNLQSTLGTLQNNGGINPTIALLAGSPAIDAGVTNTITTDQRGIARPQGSAFDSGAYEYVVPATGLSTSQLANTGQNTSDIMVAALALIITSLVCAQLFRECF